MKANKSVTITGILADAIYNLEECGQAGRNAAQRQLRVLQALIEKGYPPNQDVSDVLGAVAYNPALIPPFNVT